MLKITNLCVEADKKKILSNVSLQIRKGELHVLLGPNASGKTTLAKVIAGLCKNKIKKGQISFNGKIITRLKPEKRAKLGIALAFQHPPAIKGVKFSDFLERLSSRQGKTNLEKMPDFDRLSSQQGKTNLEKLSSSQWETNLEKKRKLFDKMPDFDRLSSQQGKTNLEERQKPFDRIGNTKQYKQYLQPQLLERDINVKFSGGEQKFSELAQVFTLNPKFAIYDEIDSGVDIKGLEKITKMIKGCFSPNNSALIITHNGSVLEFLKPDMIHVLLNGKLICSSSDWKKVWKTIKRYGYEKCKECKLFAS